MANRNVCGTPPLKKIKVSKFLKSKNQVQLEYQYQLINGFNIVDLIDCCFNEISDELVEYAKDCKSKIFNFLNNNLEDKSSVEKLKSDIVKSCHRMFMEKLHEASDRIIENLTSQLMIPENKIIKTDLPNNTMPVDVLEKYLRQKKEQSRLIFQKVLITESLDLS